jgi:hypothetical protein
MRASPWLLSLLLAGCFLANADPVKKIGDSVRSLNEQARWGRLGDAAQLVEPKYRNAYLSAHQDWGGSIELADTEILHVQLAPGNEQADALVTYSWFDKSTMTLRETTVKQRWLSHAGSYALSEEAVVRGDPKLLRAPAAAGSGDPGLYRLD